MDLTDLQLAEFQQFLQALLETMLSANGVGIAATQVFDPRAIMIVASRPNARYPDAPQMAPEVLINPQILAQSPNKVWPGKVVYRFPVYLAGSYSVY